MHSHFLFSTISKPTRVAKTSATLIDNIFIKNPLSTFSGILYCDFSDHFPVFSAIPLQSSKPVSKSIKIKLPPKINYNKLNNQLAKVNWNFITDESCVNNNYDKFLNIFQSALDICSSH